MPAPKRRTPRQRESCPWQIALWKYLVKRDTPVPETATVDKHTYLLSTVFVCPKGVLDRETGDYQSMGYAMNEDLPGIPPTSPDRCFASANSNA